MMVLSTVSLSVYVRAMVEAPDSLMGLMFSLTKFTLLSMTEGDRGGLARLLVKARRTNEVLLTKEHNSVMVR